jgi:hypothetical protein
MKRIALGLSLAAACYASSPERISNLAPVTLFVQGQELMPPAVLNSLRDEVAAILAPAGFRFRWYSVRETEAAGLSIELAVVTFRGPCDVPGSLSPGQLQAHALGFTSITNGEILPFTTIDCGRTRAFLAEALLRLPRAERAEAFGRALGRVVAHELYHIFANTPHHGRTGVAKESYTVDDLMCRDFEFDDREYELLRGSRTYSILAAAAAQ